MTESSMNSFNLKTMSGVFPGTRTRRHHTIQLLPLAFEGEPEWAKVFWAEEPPSAIVLKQDSEGLAEFDSIDGQAFPQLEDALLAAGWGMATCGTCHFWHLSDAVGPDELPLGRCAWQSADGRAGVSFDGASFRAELAAQGALAIRCIHWQIRDRDSDSRPEIAPDKVKSAALAGSEKANQPSAEEPPVEQAPWGGYFRQWTSRFLTRKWGGKQKGDRSNRGHSLLLANMERSGVGAGTEPCPCCHGRIANLCALVVETVEGDKQTLSVWRCRSCCSTFVNSWIDRWERLDNLETEEALYRVSPDEAALIFDRISTHQGGDHPQGRAERSQERDWILAFLSQRQALLHQIRHGR